MLNLSNLKPYPRSTKRRKIRGRGVGSGHGTFSGRGAKGQKARSGSSIPVGFEGGRMPLHRQIPKKRGFTSRSPKASVFNVGRIDSKFSSGESVTPKLLFQRGLSKSVSERVKILSGGKITKALIFEGILVSAQAREKIEKAGGKVNP